VSDDGKLTGVSRHVLNQSMENLKAMGMRVGAQISGFEKFKVTKGQFVAEVHLRPQLRANPDESINKPRNMTEEVRVAFIGESNAGKSTLISVLAYDHLDNGRGNARLSLLRHRHEILSGRTSSVAVEPLILIRKNSHDDDDYDELQPLRFDAIDSTEHLALSSQRQMMEAPRVLQFFDLPGKPRMHRSALTSLTSLAGPDLACLVVPASDCEGETVHRIVEEHLLLTRNLDIPTVIVLSKTDLVADKKTSVLTKLLVHGLPVFPVSAITGEGVPALLFYLSKQPKITSIYPLAPQDASVFVIESTKESEEVGLVAKGSLLQGCLDLRNPNGWLLGPSPIDASFCPVRISSIHRLRLAAHRVESGLMAAVAIESVQENKRPQATSRGLLLVKNASLHFTGKTTTCITWSSFTLIQGRISMEKEAQGTLHCGCARIAVRSRFSDANRVVIETLEEGRVLLVPGMKLVLLTSSYLLAGRYIE